MVPEIEPRISLCTDSVDPAWDSLSLSVSLSLSLSRSLSLARSLSLSLSLSVPPLFRLSLSKQVKNKI